VSAARRARLGWELKEFGGTCAPAEAGGIEPPTQSVWVHGEEPTSPVKHDPSLVEEAILTQDTDPERVTETSAYPERAKTKPKCYVPSV